MRGKVAIFFFVFAVASTAETRPRSSQIRNPQQIRIGGEGAGDLRPGTLVDSRQVEPVRWICRPTWMTEASENGQPTICTDHYYGISVAGSAIRIVQSSLAYSSVGREALFAKDPEWRTWWELHKDDPPGPADPAAVEMMRRLLTSPAIIRP